MDEEFYKKHLRAANQSKTNALEAVIRMELPKVIDIFDESFAGLGFKTNRDASQELEKLRESHGENLPYLIGLAVRESWLSLFAGSQYIALMIAAGEMNDNQHMQKMATAEGYGASEGIAWTLYGYLSSPVEQVTFLDDTPFQTRVPLDSILKGAAIYWFAAAATSHRAGDIEGAFDWISEAHDALSLVHGDLMWEEGEKSGGEMKVSTNAESAARTALAKAAAQAKHTGNRADKATVFVWCDKNMKRFSSMDDAASDIAETFIPQKFRAVRDWMTEWKKLRSAGRL